LDRSSSDFDKSQGKWLLLVALLQGLGLLLLHQSHSFGWSISDSPAWLLACYAALLTGPSILIYGVTIETPRHFYTITALYTIVAFMLGMYTGSQLLYPEHPDLPMHGFGFATIMSLLTFKVFVFAASMRNQAEQWHVSYKLLFENTCRLIITLFLASIFSLIVWLVIVLWAELFGLINIELFKDIFYEPWFVYPALSLAHAIGVLKVRRSNKVVNTANHLIQTLSLAILPLLVLLSTVFLVALAVQGLEPLWENGGSNLVFVLTALVLFTLNLAFQQGDCAPKMPKLAFQILLVCLALLPIYMGISGYGLWLRVEQYGLSISRLWAVFMWVFLTLYVTCYSISIIKNKLTWYLSLAPINTRLGLLLIAALLVSQSPLLDFKQLSAQNQLARIHNGTTQVNDIDVYYFAKDLGKAGREALHEIDAHYSDSNPQLGMRIKAAFANQAEESAAIDILDALIIKGGLLIEQIPQGLRSALQDYSESNPAPIAASKGVYLIPVHLNDDEVFEFLFIIEEADYAQILLFFKAQDKWEYQNMEFGFNSKLSRTDIIEALLDGSFTIEQPKFMDIKVKDTHLRQVNF
jgi:hypothetical protein